MHVKLYAYISIWIYIIYWFSGEFICPNCQIICLKYLLITWRDDYKC